MSLTSLTNTIQYVGDGTTETYSYTFKVFLDSDMEVSVYDSDGTKTTLVLDTDYSVTGAGDATGGDVVLLDLSQAWLDSSGYLSSAYTLKIERTPPLTQETDIRNQGAYYPETLEDQFDRLIMIDQAQQTEIDRSLKLPETETPSLALTTFPTVTQRAEKFLYFDASGNPSAASGVDTGSLVVTAFIETLLDDISASVARATLGAVGLTGDETIDGNKTFAKPVDLDSNKITNLAAGTDPADAVRFDQIVATTITGEIRMYGGSSAPSGWLSCDGSAVSRSTYASLFAILGTTFGVGDGSTTFNVPDLKGRAPIGVGTGSGLTARTLGGKVGAETHTHAMPHQHEETVGSKTSDPQNYQFNIKPPWGVGSLTGQTLSGQNGIYGPQPDVNYSLTNQPTNGSTSAGSGMQPSIGLTFIIKT